MMFVKAIPNASEQNKCLEDECKLVCVSADVWIVYVDNLNVTLHLFNFFMCK